MKHWRRYLITGLLTLFPLWLTFVVFRFVFNALSGVSAPWVHAWLDALATGHPVLGWLAAPWVQSVLALAITLLAIYLVGFAATRVFGQKLLEGFEALIGRIPLAQQIYGGAKKLLDMLQNQGGGSAQRVVLIAFPHPGVKTIGLVMRTFKDASDGRELAAVFVPTTPNPTGGYLEIVPMADLVPTDWSVDQAMAFVLSGGAVAPERIAFERKETGA